MDIAAAFLETRGFNREVFAKPPREEQNRTVLRRLTAAAYKLADSCRLWYSTSNAALNSTFGLTRSRFGSTLYFKRSATQKLDFILVAQVDNYLYCGSSEMMVFFETFFQKKFDVGEPNRNTFLAPGCKIDKLLDGFITVT